MATAKLSGKGKNQKLIIDADEPGEYSVTRTDDDNEPLKLEFKPKGKNNAEGNPKGKEPAAKERNTFFDED